MAFGVEPDVGAGLVIDHRLRVTKDRLVEPVVAHLPAAVSPLALTVLSAVCGVSAGVTAAAGWVWVSVGLWLASRWVDGLDGALARRTGVQSDLGGYLDLMADTLGYAAVPIGIAAASGGRGAWAACAVLLASFYLNTTSWTLLAAIAEKRGAGAATTGERTTVHMPVGLIEGAETIVLYTAMLLLPSHAVVLFSLMAALVGGTIAQRLVWAARTLR